jgi:hypothetical protein
MNEEKSWAKYRSLLEPEVPRSFRSVVSAAAEPGKSARDRAKALGWRLDERIEDDAQQNDR